MRRPPSYAGVRSWPQFLIRDMPPELRESIEEDAAESQESMAEIMRGILCSHFGLTCDRVDSFTEPERIAGTATYVLRMQPEVFRALRRESEATAIPMRTLVIGALQEHYEEER